MEKLTIEKFSEIYKQKIESNLSMFEALRVQYRRFSYTLLGLAFVVLILGILFYLWVKSIAGIIVAIVFLVVSLMITSHKRIKINHMIKKDVTSKILQMFGNLYFNGKSGVSFGEIRSMGLFPRFSRKTEGDNIVGSYKGCNFLINESRLTHTETRRSGKSTYSKTIEDFSGLIVKIQMKKNFSGTTIVGIDGNIEKMKGFEPVELESVKFMQGRKIYSTDQIEARYLLTTSFMERLDNLGKIFMISSSDGSFTGADGEDVSAEAAVSAFNQLEAGNSFFAKHLSSFMKQAIGVSAAFADGFVYLFIPAGHDFFEVDLNVSLLEVEQYYKIYNEISSILEVIDLLKLDQKLGL